MKKLFFVFVIFLSILFIQAQPSKAYIGQCCSAGSDCPGEEVCTAPSTNTPYGTCTLSAGYTCQLPTENQGTTGDTCTPTGNECQEGYRCFYSSFGYTCIPSTSNETPRDETTVTQTDSSGLLGGGDCSDTEINTAIGCIPINDTDELIGFILRWAIGVGGGIAFLLIVLAGFQIMTSSGNPDRLKAGQELMTSAIAGLILLIFSVFILKIIGVDILGLPGFGGSP